MRQRIRHMLKAAAFATQLIPFLVVWTVLATVGVGPAVFAVVWLTLFSEVLERLARWA